MEIEDLTNPRWECVHFVDAGPDVGELTSRLIKVATVDGSAVRTKEELIDQIEVGFEFPDYFSSNWDAVEESLREVPNRIAAEGYVLIVRSAEQLWRNDPKSAGALVEVWLGVARQLGWDGVSFHLVFEW